MEIMGFFDDSSEDERQYCEIAADFYNGGTEKLKFILNGTYLRTIRENLPSKFQFSHKQLQQEEKEDFNDNFEVGPNCTYFFYLNTVFVFRKALEDRKKSLEKNNFVSIESRDVFEKKYKKLKLLYKSRCFELAMWLLNGIPRKGKPHVQFMTSDELLFCTHSRRVKYRSGIFSYYAHGFHSVLKFEACILLLMVMQDDIMEEQIEKFLNYRRSSYNFSDGYSTKVSSYLSFELFANRLKAIQGISNYHDAIIKFNKNFKFDYIVEALAMYHLTVCLINLEDEHKEAVCLLHDTEVAFTLKNVHRTLFEPILNAAIVRGPEYTMTDDNERKRYMDTCEQLKYIINVENNPNLNKQINSEHIRIIAKSISRYIFSIARAMPYCSKNTLQKATDPALRLRNKYLKYITQQIVWYRENYEKLMVEIDDKEGLKAYEYAMDVVYDLMQEREKEQYNVKDLPLGKNKLKLQKEEEIIDFYLLSDETDSNDLYSKSPPKKKSKAVGNSNIAMGLNDNEDNDILLIFGNNKEKNEKKDSLLIFAMSKEENKNCKIEDNNSNTQKEILAVKEEFLDAQTNNNNAKKVEESNEIKSSKINNK